MMLQPGRKLPGRPCLGQPAALELAGSVLLVHGAPARRLPACSKGGSDCCQILVDAAAQRTPPACLWSSWRLPEQVMRAQRAMPTVRPSAAGSGPFTECKVHELASQTMSPRMDSTA